MYNNGIRADKVYCDECEEWLPIDRRATAYEVAGIKGPIPQSEQLGGLFDTPPF